MLRGRLTRRVRSGGGSPLKSSLIVIVGSGGTLAGTGKISCIQLTNIEYRKSCNRMKKNGNHTHSVFVIVPPRIIRQMVKVTLTLLSLPGRKILHNTTTSVPKRPVRPSFA